jgi:hypothetical protein
MVDMVGCGQGMSCLSLQPLRQRKVLAADHEVHVSCDAIPCPHRFTRRSLTISHEMCKLAGAVRVASVSRDDTTAASSPFVMTVVVARDCA